MSTVIIFRKYTNDIAPYDTATLRELKVRLQKIAEEGTDAEFKAAQKEYDDFVDKLKSKSK